MKSIRHTATLYYYDGAQVFEARDSVGGHYIAVMVEPDGGQDQYLVAEVEPERLRQFRNGTLDLRSLLTERGDEEWFLAKVSGGLEAPLALQPQATALTASSYLPEPGFLLHNSITSGNAGLDLGCATGALKQPDQSISKTKLASQYIATSLFLRKSRQAQPGELRSILQRQRGRWRQQCHQQLDHRLTAGHSIYCGPK
jgi:hypothetical protein